MHIGQCELNLRNSTLLVCTQVSKVGSAVSSLEPIALGERDLDSSARVVYWGGSSRESKSGENKSDREVHG